MYQRKKKKPKSDLLKPTVRWIERLKKITDRLKYRNDRKIRKSSRHNNEGGLLM